MMLSPLCEGSIHTGDCYPSPSLLGPAMGWARNIPLPTLVAYREKASHTPDGCNFWHLKPSLVQVFPKEVHHILPLERPEWWVTCDSIGLFLETECRFPLESEDERYHYHEEHELAPGYRQTGCGLTRSFLKGASAELIDLYRRFVSPTNPRFCFLLASTTARAAPYPILLCKAFPSSRACSYTDSICPRFVTPPVLGSVDPEICRLDPLSLDTPLLNSPWKIRCDNCQ